MFNTLKPKRSRAVAELRYSKRERTLTVQYLNGGRYIYAQVSPSAWRMVKRMGKNEGYGRAVNSIVKPNFNYLRVN